MNLKHQSAVGAAWLTGATFGGSACQFLAVAVVLGAELSTESFARIAALNVAMNLCFILARLGLGHALIQRAKLTDADINSVFWVGLANSLLVGGALAVVAVLGAGRLFWLDLRPYMLGLSAVVVAYGAGLAPHNLLLRDMRYRDSSIAEGLSSLAFAVVACAVVYIRPTLLSIVCAFFARQATDAVVCFYLSGWRPRRPSLRGKPLREMLRFGSFLTASESVSYAGANAAVPIIGGMLGDGPLGMFDMANRIVVFPMRRVIGIMARVLLPVFSRAQDDDARMRRGYCLLIRYQAMTACPAMIGLILVAPELARALLDPKWADSIILIQLRCPYGLFIVLGAWMGLIFRAKNRVDLEWYYRLATAALMIGGMWATALTDSVGFVVAAQSALAGVLFIAGQKMAGKIIGLGLWKGLASASQPLAATAGMAAVHCLVRLGFPSLALWPDWASLSFYTLLGAASYAGFLFSLCPGLIREIRVNFSPSVADPGLTSVLKADIE